MQQNQQRRRSAAFIAKNHKNKSVHWHFPQGRAATRPLCQPKKGAANRPLLTFLNRYISLRSKSFKACNPHLSFNWCSEAHQEAHRAEQKISASMWGKALAHSTSHMGLTTVHFAMQPIITMAEWM
jgi:hypothetical protein